MFTIPLLTILLTQGILGFAYVILEEEDGYYKAWRSNPVEPQPNPWSSFMNPQYYFPFLQNMNPFSWWQPQQPMMQENPALNMVYDRQKLIFNILRCVVEEGPQGMCKKLLRNAMPMFPEAIQVTEIWITKPAASKPTIMEIKPLQNELTVLPSKLVEDDLPQSKPNAIEVVTMEVKPMMIKPTIMPKPLEVETQAKPIETDMTAIEGNPYEAEPALPKPIEIEEVMKPTTMEIKPLEAESTVLDAKPLEDPLPELAMERIETQPVATEIKPADINSKSAEAEPAIA